MDFTGNRGSADASEITRIPTTLARWYAVHSTVRRLWAVEDQDTRLNVFVTLEPTSDGDDMLPVWFARHHDWAIELKALTRRDVQLELVVSGVLDRALVSMDSAMIAELDWRDPWTSP